MSNYIAVRCRTGFRVGAGLTLSLLAGNVCLWMHVTVTGLHRWFGS